MIFKSPNTWQATCCRTTSHAKPHHPGTKCCRSRSFKGERDGLEDLMAQRLLKHWLNQSMYWGSREDHMAVTNESLLECLPSDDALAHDVLDSGYKTPPESPHGVKRRLAESERRPVSKSTKATPSLSSRAAGPSSSRAAAPVAKGDSSSSSSSSESSDSSSSHSS